MSEIIKKIEALQEEVKQETCRNAAAARRTLLVYAALVVFVAAYSLFLTTTIRRDATPNALSIVFLEKVRDSLPQLLDGVEEKMEANATNLAEKTVKSIYHIIPQVTEMAKVQCDLLIEAQLNEIEATYMPKIRRKIKVSMEKIIANKDLGKDKDLAKALTMEVVNELDREVGEILGKEFFNRLDELTANVKALRVKKVSTMTNREYAERKMIVYWLFMTDHGRTGNSVMASFLSSTTDAFLDYYKLEKLRGSMKKTAK
jgi:hypothetical protein